MTLRIADPTPAPAEEALSAHQKEILAKTDVAEADYRLHAGNGVRVGAETDAIRLASAGLAEDYLPALNSLLLGRTIKDTVFDFQDGYLRVGIELDTRDYFSFELRSICPYYKRVPGLKDPNVLEPELVRDWRPLSPLYEATHGV